MNPREAQRNEPDMTSRADPIHDRLPERHGMLFPADPGLDPRRNTPASLSRRPRAALPTFARIPHRTGFTAARDGIGRRQRLAQAEQAEGAGT